MFKRRSKKRYRSGLKGKKPKYFRVFLVFLAFFVSFGGAGSRFLEMDSITINEIKFDGNLTTNEKELKNFVEKNLAGAYFSIFPKKSSLIYPKSVLEEGILDDFKRIKDIDISRNGFSAINIKVREREPYALWCLENVENKDEKQEDEDNKKEDENIENKCFFIDKEGFIFSKAPYFTGNIYFKYYTKLLNKTDKDFLGENIMEKEVFNKTKKFISKIEDENLKPKALFERGGGDYSVLLSSNSSIIFSVNNNLEKNFLDLKSALSSKPLINSSLEDIDYIDLRFSDKIFYKFR